MIQLILFQLICTKDNLRDAWFKVKSKKAMGGIDGIGISDFDKNAAENLKKLRDDLLRSCYTPEPYKRIYIPKYDGTTEKRPLGLPSVRDKIVQQAVRSVIEPLFEKGFLDSSYAYRPGRSSYQAIRRVQHYISQGCCWVASCDVDRYFDTINHPVLMQLVSKKITDPEVLRLIKLWIKMGVIENKKGWQDNFYGICQGSVISPLLANIYLHPFDMEMRNRGYAYIRYADDFCIFSRNRPELERAVIQAKRFLDKRLKLVLDDCEISAVSRGFTFLGLRYDGKTFDISQKKKGKLQGQLARTLKTCKTLPLAEAITKLNQMTTGWKYYYCRLLETEQLSYLRRLLIDGLAPIICEKLKNKELRNHKEAAITLKPLEWGNAGENQKLIKDLLEQTRKLRVKQKSAKLGLKEVSSAVSGKKRKYQRIRARESDLLVATPGSFIGKQSRQVIVKYQGRLVKRIAEIALSQIIIISRGVTLSSDVIRHCSEKNIPVHFLTPNGKPYALIYSPLYPALELGLSQLQACRGAQGTAIAKSIVAGKVKNQANLIKYCSKYRKSWDDDFAQIFKRFISDMKNYGREIKAIPDSDPDIARGKLFSVEGRAAAAYWEMFETVVNNKTEFDGRKRRGASDLVNSMLNYGYGVLYSRIWLALSLAGLNLRLSFLHKEQAGKPTLVYDFIEEFRQPAVDRAVISLINRGEELKQEKTLLDQNTRQKVALAVLERLNTPLKFRGRNLSLAEIINNQARELAKCIKNDKAYKPFVSKW